MAASSARQQSSQAERTEDARKVFLESLAHASSDLDADLRSRAKIIHENQVQVSEQDTELQRQIKQLAQENTETEEFLDQTKQKLAKFDDWGKVGDELELDLNDLEAMLDLLEEQEIQDKTNKIDKTA